MDFTSSGRLHQQPPSTFPQRRQQQEHGFRGGRCNNHWQYFNTTIDGVRMPNKVWRPAVGNRYVVLNMYMPDEFLCDTDNKAGAEWELFREAVK